MLPYSPQQVQLLRHQQVLEPAALRLVAARAQDLPIPLPSSTDQAAFLQFPKLILPIASALHHSDTPSGINGGACAILLKFQLIYQKMYFEDNWHFGLFNL